MEIKDIKEAFQPMVDALKNEAAENAQKHEAAVNEINEALKKKGEDLETIKGTVDSLNEGIREIKAAQGRVETNSDLKNPATFMKQFSTSIADQFEKQKGAFEAFGKSKNATLSFEMKAVGDMLISSNLTGDGVASYSPKSGLVPAHKVNFRDLIPTTQSPTGIYVHYRETGTEGAIAVQTEGQGKGQIDYDFTEVKTVSDYIAGYARFSKQMMYQLPWLQSTLPRLLMRDFMKKENSTFYGVVAAGATGTATTTGITVDAEQVIGWIANQLNADFTPSFGLVNFTDWTNLLLTKPSDYSVPGGVSIDLNGNIRIAGVPIIGASWATADKFMLIDADFIERVETESMRVEFSYEDATNFTTNKVTARVECFEDLNLLRTDAHIYGDFGNVA